MSIILLDIRDIKYIYIYTHNIGQSNWMCKNWRLTYDGDNMGIPFGNPTCFMIFPL